MTAAKVYTPHIGRGVWIREETSDAQVWADTFTGLYHLPPEEMPIPATVLDLGANIGLTAAHYRHLWREARIVAVEMDEQNAALAARNAPGVVVRRTAVASVPGVGHYDPEAEAYAYRLTEALPGFAGPLRVETLEAIILEEFGGPVDFVKMDVEGQEWDIFEGLPEWGPLVRHLVVELHGREGKDRLIALAIRKLEAADFRARAHPPHPAAVYAFRA